jgi:hypothetical protein
MPKEKGGLGMKDVAIQNQCLLLKLLHRLHHPANLAWARWAREEVDLSILKGKNAVGPHWEALRLRSLLPLYQSITFVGVGDGRATDFWNDCWTGKVPLAACFSNLFSHAKVKEIQLLFERKEKKEIQLQKVVDNGLHEFLVSRLSRMAAGELEQVLGITTKIVLEDRPDNCICPFAAADGVLQAGPVYKAIKTHGISQSLLLLAWSNCAPPSGPVLCLAFDPRKNPVPSKPEEEINCRRRQLQAVQASIRKCQSLDI